MPEQKLTPATLSEPLSENSAASAFYLHRQFFFRNDHIHPD